MFLQKRGIYLEKNPRRKNYTVEGVKGCCRRLAINPSATTVVLANSTCYANRG